MYQKLTIVGNVGNAPELRYTNSGVPVASFNVATNRVFTTADGEKNTKTVWFKVTAWRKLAELVDQYVTKGMQVLVTGEIEEPRAYIGRDGEPHATIEVTADVVRFMSRSDHDQGHGTSTGKPADTGEWANDEDIPF